MLNVFKDNNSSVYQLENNSVATATQNQLSPAVLSVLLFCQAEGGISTVDFLDSLKMF